MTYLLKTHPFFGDKQIASCERLKNQGYCNENYEVMADGQKYLVRKLLKDGIDRAFEWRVQKSAYVQGITAEPLVFDEEHGLMIFAFLEGEHKKILDQGALKVLAQTLCTLHNISVNTPPVTLQTDTTAVDSYSKEYVLCHNDLNAGNLLWKERDVKLIDFEYAGVNDRYFDLASVCVEFGLEKKMQEVFLRAYFEDEDFIFEKLEAYKTIYKNLCEEWFENHPTNKS